MKNLLSSISLLGICACGHTQAMQYENCRFAKALMNKNTAIAKNMITAGHVNIDFAVLSAIGTGSIESVETLYRSGKASINKINSITGSSALHMATIYGKLEIVKWLLSHGADVNILDAHAEPPIYYADMDKSGKITKYLIEHGAEEYKKIGTYGKFGFLPIFSAVFLNDTDALTRMLYFGANPNIRTKFDPKKVDMNLAFQAGCTNRLTLLQFAVLCNKAECVRLLLEHGAVIDEPTLCIAKQQKSSDIQLLLSKYMIFSANTNILRHMLDNGADPNVRIEFALNKLHIDSDIRKGCAGQLTPIQFASLYNKAESARLLLEHGAVIDEPTLYIAKQQKSPDILKLLFEHLSKLADHPLHYAIQFGDISLVSKILKDGADPRIVAELMNIGSADPHIAEMIKSADERQDIPMPSLKTKLTAFELAADIDSPEILELLMAHTPEPNTEYLCNALCVAARSKRLKSTRMLAEQLRKKSLTEDQRRSIFLASVENASKDIFDLLYFDLCCQSDFSNVNPNRKGIALYAAKALRCWAVGELTKDILDNYIYCINVSLSCSGDNIYAAERSTGVSVSSLLQEVYECLQLQADIHRMSNDAAGAQECLSWREMFRQIRGFTPRRIPPVNTNNGFPNNFPDNSDTRVIQDKVL